MNRRRLLRTLMIVVLALAAYWLQSRQEAAPRGPGSAVEAPAAPAAGRDAVARAFRDRRSDLPVEVAGSVQRTLPDDREGSRHQRFILDLGDGLTVLVAHNIDLAPRVPLRAGDRVRVRGEYEWNDRGGVIHWTHHDPRGRHPGGWVHHAGDRYE